MAPNQQESAGQPVPQNPSAQKSNSPAMNTERPSRGLHRMLNLIIIACVFICIAGFGGYVYKRTGPKLPQIDRSRFDDPAVLTAIESAVEDLGRNRRTAAKWGRLGMILMAHDSEEDADRFFAVAADLDQSDPRWPYLRYVIRQGASQDENLPLLEQAAQLCGDVAAPKLLLGEVLCEKQQLDEAERIANSVLKTDPENARAEFLMGRVALARNDLSSSLQHLQAAAKVRSNVQEIHTTLAQVHLRMQNEDAARHEQQLAAKLPIHAHWPDPYMREVNAEWKGLKQRYRRATNLIMLGDLSEAHDVCEQMVKVYPDSAPAHLLLGRVLINLKQPNESALALKKALELDPEMTAARRELGRVLLSQLEFQQAAHCLRIAIEQQPNQPDAYLLLSRCLIGLDDVPGAIEALRTALRIKPELLRAYRELADLLSRSDQKEEARQVLEQALKISPDDPKTRELVDQLDSQSNSPPP